MLGWGGAEAPREQASALRLLLGANWPAGAPRLHPGVDQTLGAKAVAGGREGGSGVMAAQSASEQIPQLKH